MVRNKRAQDFRGVTLLIAQFIILVSVIVLYIYLSATQVAGPSRVIKGYVARSDVDSLLYQWVDKNVDVLQAQDDRAVPKLKSWFSDNGYSADVSCDKLRSNVLGCELTLVKKDGKNEHRDSFTRDVLVPTQNGVLTVFVTGTVTV